MNRDKIIEDLKIEEGRKVANGRHYVYRDHMSYATVGYGRMVDRQKGGGLTEAEAIYLLNNDIDTTEAELSHRFPHFSKLDEVRQRALIMMAFQMGVPNVMKFKNMLNALMLGDHKIAAASALNSAWAREQTPDRAQRVAHMLSTGTDPQPQTKGQSK